jgi:hypothetical protein
VRAWLKQRTVLEKLLGLCGGLLFLMGVLVGWALLPVLLPRGVSYVPLNQHCEESATMHQLICFYYVAEH